MRWLVDGMNVIGSRPDGWWRDRDGAVRRLVAGLFTFAERSGDHVTVVFDGRPVEIPEAGPVEVIFATRPGRDAADDDIARIAAAAEDGDAITVVTSDSDLAERARAAGATVIGAGAFRRHALD